MSFIYRVESLSTIRHDDPLHVDNFYPQKQRVHRKTRAARQDLILYLANLHSRAMRTGMPRGMCAIPIRLMALRQWVSDYRIVLDHFFEVQSLGYSLGDKFDVSYLIPKKQLKVKDEEASNAATDVQYIVPIRPSSCETISKVFIQQHNRESILRKLAVNCRLDLLAPVEWLLKQPEVNFHFAKSGKLQQRDTSTWPIAAIETWPAWLREDLFGGGIDIDSAYTQFIVSNLRTRYDEADLKRYYPDLLRSLEDKKQWRQEICGDILGLPITEENIGTVKRLCMSLANGSRISPSILTGSRAFSVTADIVFASTDDVSLENLTRIGKRLSRIADQYVLARKILCSSLLRQKASRKNQKEVFSEYFKWERTARYLIWEEIGRVGVMIHDGIDGIPQEQLNRLPEIMEKLKLRLTA